MGRNSCCVKAKLRKGLWSPEEDDKLYNYITRFGVGCWSSVPKLAGLQRCGKSCRLRWINYLRPDLKRGMFSQQEEDLIINLHQALGNRWAQIAAQLPGRTDNEIKNFWNSSLKKKLLKQGVDPNTHKPLDSHIVIKDERERDENERAQSSSLQQLQQAAAHHQNQMYNLSSMMCNNGGKIRDINDFPDKQLYDPIFLSDHFQANVVDHDAFQSNFLSHPNYERETNVINPIPISGFNSMPNLTNFDHQSLEKFMMNEGKESSSSNFHHSIMMQTNNSNNNNNNNGGEFSWNDDSKLDSVFQFQFSGIQIEERSNNNINEKMQNHQIISDEFANYPLNMSVFDHSI